MKCIRLYYIIKDTNKKFNQGAEYIQLTYIYDMEPAGPLAPVEISNEEKDWPLPPSVESVLS